MTGAVITPERRGRRSGPARTSTRTTPSWLRVASTVLAGLAVLAGAVALVAVLGRQSATSTARSSAEPLLVDAQAVITSLSDADTTAAGSLLAGRVPPESAVRRYAGDLAAASAALAAAARQAGATPDAADVRTVAVGLPVYAGLVQTALADQRQGLPVAAAYLGEASGYLRSGLLPPASALYAEAGRHLADDRSRASRAAVAVIAVAAAVVVLIGLLRLQLGMARRFRRLINVPAAVATLAVLAALAWAGAALGAQGQQVQRAAQRGSTPLQTYTQVRILALQARADDELTLVTRDSVPSYQKDYAAVAARIAGLVNPATAAAAEQSTLRQAQADWTDLQAAHAGVRAADTAGDLTTAIARASGTAATDLPGAAAALDSTLSAGVGGAQAAFDASLAAAAGDLRGLAVGLSVLFVAAALLVVLGAQQRIAEYR